MLTCCFRFLLLLFSVALLGGSLGCTRQATDPAPAAPAAASYKLGGQLKACAPRTYATTSSGNDYLSVLLMTTPEPTRGWEQLQLLLVKRVGQPTTAYQAAEFRLSGSGTTSTTYDAPTFTLTVAGDKLSGTFSAAPPAGSPGALTITEGVFTNVPL